MSTTKRQAHWENVYTTRGRGRLVSADSRAVVGIDRACRSHPHSAIIDIGGGASRLVDSLVSQGYEDVTVLDLSASALEGRSDPHRRTGEAVHWLAADKQYRPKGCYKLEVMGRPEPPPVEPPRENTKPMKMKPPAPSTVPGAAHSRVLWAALLFWSQRSLALRCAILVTDWRRAG
jgi:hypothetical protein